MPDGPMNFSRQALNQTDFSTPIIVCLQKRGGYLILWGVKNEGFLLDLLVQQVATGVFSAKCGMDSDNKF